MFAAAFTASPTGSAAVPAWVSVTGTISAMVTAAAVLVGGTIAYFNFLRNRLSPRCLIDMNCELRELAGARGLWVSVIFQNVGTTPVLISSDFPQVLQVSQANAALWWLACERGRPVYWEESTIKPIQWELSVPEGAIFEALEIHDNSTTRKPRRTISWYGGPSGAVLEPGDQWERSPLIPVAPNSVAYLLRVQISACRHVASWHVGWHRRYCLRTPSRRRTWWREIHVFREEHR